MDAPPPPPGSPDAGAAGPGDQDEPATEPPRSNGTLVAIVILVLVILGGLYIHRYGFELPGIHQSQKRHPFRTLVPDVVGDTYAVAFGRITAAGLCTRRVTYELNPGTPRNAIVSQAPTGGRVIPNLTGVDLVISSGRTSAPPPSDLSQMEPTCP